MRVVAICMLPVALVAASCAPAITAKDRAIARTRHDIGVTYLSQGALRDALRELLGAVEADPELADAHNALGLVYHALGRHKEALDHYDKAVLYNPEFSEAHNNRGALLLALERYDGAIASFKKALGNILYATPSLAEGNLGWAYFKKGEVETGITHLRNAVAMNPKFCRGYGWLAEIETERDKPDQVVAYCMRFEKHCTGDPAIARTIPPSFLAEMKFRLGFGYEKLGHRKEARAAFSECAAEQSESAAEFQTKCARSLAALD
jgi:type IV pilus biogenesis/stability protein PilW